MISGNQLDLLQIIGLSLPFIALYLGVLVDIHKIPKPVKVASPNDVGFEPVPSFARNQISEDEEWAGTVPMSYAYQEWDFVAALFSIGFILISAVFILLSILLNIDYISKIGFLALIISYICIIISVVLTLIYAKNNFSPSNES